MLNIILVLGFTAFATPARPGQIYLSQPDGSGFYARFYGDELMRIKVTDDGSSIIQDEDGWWSYAVYNEKGHKISTGCHVGYASSDTNLAACRNIPYNLLAHKANLKRNEAEYNRIQRTPAPVMMKANAEATQKNKAGLVILAQMP